MNPFLAQIMLFAGTYAPRDWAFCDGRLLNINDYQSLYSLLGTTYGGNGSTTFALPDLRGRAPMQFGTGPGLTKRSWGEKGGSETYTLSVDQIPAHQHALLASEVANSSDPTGNYIAATGSNEFATGTNEQMNMNSTTKTGEGAIVNNLQPFICLNYIIALQGEFPSRN